MKKNREIPMQQRIVNIVDNIPVEYFKWGNHPDHFKIDPPHRHKFTELVFFIKGGGNHEIGHKNYKIEDYSVHYIPESIVHFLKREHQSDGFTIAYDETFLEQNNIKKLMIPFNSEPFVMNLSEAKFNRLLDQANVLQQQVKRQRGHYKQRCLLLSLELLITSIAADQEYYNKKTLYLHNGLFAKFKNKVKANIYNNSSVSWYAEQLNISPKYLGNQVKKHAGISAKQYIIEALLYSVKMTLINTNKSIKEIAFEHNCDESKLCRLFKKQTDSTMKTYRSLNNVEK